MPLSASQVSGGSTRAEAQIGFLGTASSQQHFSPIDIAISRSALLAQPKRSNFALGNQAIWAMLGKYLGLPAVLAVIALVLLALPSHAAEERVRIPEGCREVADRAGLPLTLTHAEAARAIAYIRIMISQDPAVARCRVALRGY